MAPVSEPSQRLAYEVEAQLLVAERLHFIRLDELEASIRVIKPAGKALAGLIRWVMAQQPSNRATQKPT
jgi:hypothetical protein